MLIVCAVIRGIGLVGLALSMLCACSEPQAGTLPSASPSSSPSPTATPTPTPTSASIEDALADATKTYYTTLARVSATPTDADVLGALIHPRCECREVVGLLRDLADQRHRLEFTVTLGEPRVTIAEATNGTVFIDVSQSAGKEVDADGNTVRSLPATRGEYVVDLARSDDRWLVHRITRRS